jgi:hypothetical protein
MRVEVAVREIFERFGAVARVRISGASTTGFMIDAPGAKGRNPNTGIGSLRRITGRLSRSVIGAGNEGLFEVDISPDAVRVSIGSKVPYAAAHEFGFNGSVNVPSHTRRITQAFGRDITPRSVQVRSFVRAMNIPARPYLEPAIDSQLDWLADWLSKEISAGVSVS